MRKQEIKIALRENPNLERALAMQLIGMGYLIHKSLPLYQQLDAIPEHILGRLIDGITDAIKSTPKAASGLIGGMFNITEDLMFGAVNAFSSGPPIPTYRQSLKDAKKYKRRR